MFADKLAWFSDSVPHERRRIWEAQGGREVELEQAELIFGQSMVAQDTTRLYTSEAYCNDRLAVFHSSYIDACAKAGDTKRVVLGDYFMPPVNVYKVIKNKVSYVWEDEIDNVQMQTQVTPPSPKKRQPQKQKKIVDPRQGYTPVSQLPQVSGPLIPFIMGQDGCSAEFLHNVPKRPRLQPDT